MKHQSNQDTTDRAFYQKWKPKPRHPIAIPQPESKFSQRLRQLYLSGMSVKRIALELNCGTTTISRHRVALNLPRRTLRDKPKPKLHSYRLDIPEELNRLIEARTFGRKSKRRYVIDLIKRDMGL